ATILCNLFGSANDLSCEQDSLIDSCAMDPECQRLVGKLDANNAKDYISRSIRSLYTRPLNACTRELWDHFGWLQSPNSPSVELVAEKLLPLASYDPRMLISFAVISAQCIDKSKYTALLRGPISEILDKSGPKSNLNDFVDSVLRIVTQYQGFMGDHLLKLQPSLMKSWNYDGRSLKLPESFGALAECFPQESAVLEKGRIYMVQSIVNPDASFSIAEKLYHKTLGEKVWIPLRHATVTKMPQLVENILAAEIAGSTSTVVQDCIDADTEIGTDWKKVWNFELSYTDP
ncbi:hypothetical protein PSACC_03638, partial [Paramicrosporidium saccamoebae]